MAKRSATAATEVTFPAEWSWALDHPRKRGWKKLTTTPGEVRVAPGRLLGVELALAANDTDLAALLALLPALPISRIVIPGDGGVTSAGLGHLAALSGYVNLRAICSYDPDPAGRHDWVLALEGHPTRPGLEVALPRWPGADVARAAGAVGSLRKVDWDAESPSTPFPLGPLFCNRGLRTLKFRGGYRHEYDWSGLSALAELRELEVHKGRYNAGFWDELSRLPRVERLNLEWLAGADPQPGVLKRLKSVTELELGFQRKTRGPVAWQEIGRLPAVKKLKVEHGELDDDMAAGLAGLESVEDAYVWNVEFTDAGLSSFGRLKRLRSLVLCEASRTSTPVTDAGFRAIGKLTKLESLQLQGFEGVGPAGWAALRALKRLRRLHLFSLPPFDLMEAVGTLPTVEELTISFCNSVGPAGWAAVAAMPALRALTARALSVRPNTSPLPAVCAAAGLESLSLTDLGKVTDADLHSLGALSNLHTLALSDLKKVSDIGIGALAAFGLQRLTLARMPKLTDAALRTLSRMTGLRGLSLRCTTKMTDAGLAALAKLSHLESLELEYARNLTGPRLRKLAAALPLRELTVMESPHVSDADVLALTKHPTLQRARFHFCKAITAAGRAAVHGARPDWYC